MGNIGSTLTRRLSAPGHEVAVADSRGPESLPALADETGARAATLLDVVQDAEVVIVAVPQLAIPALPSGRFAGLAPDVPVVDTSNHASYLRDAPIVEIEDGKAESRWTADRFGRPVVKSFTTISSTSLSTLGGPAGSAGRIALPVAGDGGAAKETVMRLVDELGFDPVDAGSLDESWRQQPGTPGYTTDLDAAALEQALADATRAQTVAWRTRRAGVSVAEAMRVAAEHRDEVHGDVPPGN